MTVFLYPTPELLDDAAIEDVRFSTRIRNALNAAGIKTVGEVREASDATLLSLPSDKAPSRTSARCSACRHATM
jgi:DNA-directed RNA polymerase alpha subunit